MGDGERTHGTIEINATVTEVMNAIADLENYPEWVDTVKRVTVLDTTATGRPRTARFEIDAGPISETCVLRYDWSTEPESVTWWRIEGNVLKKLDGTYRLVERGDGTIRISYELVLELSLPVIGLIRRRAEKIIIGAALKGLKRRVEGG